MMKWRSSMTRSTAARLLVPLALAGAIIAGCSALEPVVPQVASGSSSWAEPPPGYLGADAGIDGALVIGPPPTPDSARGKADRARFNETRKLVNTPTWTQAIADADLSGREGLKSFSCAAGVTISPEATPTLARMLLRMTSDASTIYRPAKAAYKRPRPPLGNTKPICVPREPWIETDGSYPSGHGLIGWSWALVISEVAPDKASQILARGRAFGDSRIICGVHFQSDIEAGRYLGSAMVSRLHGDAAFEADLATAKAEIRASRASGAPQGCS
jgi:acid phosphatase (class A)